MNRRILLLAAATQAALVILLFAFLLVLPLPSHFFSDWGAIIGPLAWIVCSLGTARILGLSLSRTAVASAAGGVTAGLAGLVVEHSLSLPVAVAVFAVGCSAQRPARRSDRQEELALSLNE